MYLVPAQLQQARYKTLSLSHLDLGVPLSKNLNKPVLGFWGGGSILSGSSLWDSFLFKLPLDEEDKDKDEDKDEEEEDEEDDDDEEEDEEEEEEEVDSFADVDFLPKKLVMEVVAAWG
jgi:ABC-type Zn2+ transport system substrate-binding protein/surface adhesin